MKANAGKRKIFDAVDLLTEDASAQTTEVKAENGVEQIAIDSIKAFHNHPFHMYEGERLGDMVEREAMESDEREGLVREYLEALLPDNWDDMDTFERRNFLDGTGKADIGKKGTVRRTQVCNMEIWCECFGKERSNLKRADSNELSGILVKLGWVRLDRKERVANYGPQFIFVPKERN